MARPIRLITLALALALPLAAAADTPGPTVDTVVKSDRGPTDARILAILAEIEAEERD